MERLEKLLMDSPIHRAGTFKVVHFDALETIFEYEKKRERIIILLSFLGGMLGLFVVSRKLVD